MSPTRQSPRKHARFRPDASPNALEESRMNQAISIISKGKLRHCRRCEGRPLLTQCVHSAKSRTRNQIQASQQPTNQPASAVGSSMENPVAPRVNLLTQQSTILPAHTTEDSEENPFLSQTEPRTPIRSRPETLRYPPVTLPSASTDSRSSVEPPSSPIPSSPQPSLNLLPSISSSNAAATPGASLPSDSPQHSLTATPGTSSVKRVRAKKSDPIYGFVQGCHRGGGKVTIYRKRALRPAQTQQAQATSRYHEGVQDILGRAERVAVESSSWVMVLAQHPNAHKGCYYFLSPRIYKDGVAPKALEFAQGFSDLTASLIQARRKDAAALAADNETLKRNLSEAQAKQAELLQRLEALEGQDGRNTA